MWRDRADNETFLGATTPPMSAYNYLISDVVKISGMDLARDLTSGDSVETDVFALEMTYDPALISPATGSEASLAAAGKIFIAYLDSGTSTPTDYDPGTNPDLLWVNAVAGDFGGASVATGFQGVETWAQFVSANSISDANLSDYLGDWGVDVTDHEAWAVLDHNSEFAVAVPEPASLGVWALGAIGLLGRRKTRRQLARGGGPHRCGVA